MYTCKIYPNLNYNSKNYKYSYQHNCNYVSFTPNFTGSKVKYNIQDETLSELMQNRESNFEVNWDNNYIKCLDMQFLKYDDDGTLEDLVRCANKKNFWKFVHGDNIYGMSNELTRDEFENKYNLDYHNWLHPSQNCNVVLLSNHLSNNEQINENADLIYDSLCL